jgi:hypothetical protein
VPSNIQGLRAQKQQELELVQAEKANIDFPAEKALMDQAEATFKAAPAHAAYARANNRWTVINDIINREQELLNEIELFTP